MRPWIKKGLKNVIALALTLLVLSLIIDHLRRPVAPQNALAQEWVDINDRTLHLGQLSEEKPVLLYFWGSWCSICRLTSPAVASLADEGVQVVSVALRSGDKSAVAAYLREHDYHFRTINDPQGVLAKAWQVQVTPSIIIIKQGKIVHATTGLASPWGLKLRLWLA
ncbi:protein disulfide oxidoreductase [Pasteurellaceae bacterium HPA106]|uniref:protein disulfide oxidoreductase n=1 Tax=Spirabiliibacterium pneumoniae TaxID=221400 RepID=UPI001AADE383|nr:protein disulfide oxidoreductase [Spirabiliibacterium pneumoniae]MBE2895949.1 protein disulfide oxidoreductase [Spirabiliibacterium pneumoniae]